MSYVCPNCGQWWAGPSVRDIRTPITARQCPDCARAQAAYDDERQDRRQDES